MIQKTLQNGSTVTAFPISIPQQFMFFMGAQYGAQYPVNNIGMAYYIHGDIDTTLMKEAIREAIARCDTMKPIRSFSMSLKLPSLRSKKRISAICPNARRTRYFPQYQEKKYRTMSVKYIR